MWRLRCVTFSSTATTPVIPLFRLPPLAVGRHPLLSRLCLSFYPLYYSRLDATLSHSFSHSSSKWRGRSRARALFTGSNAGSNRRPRHRFPGKECIFFSFCFDADKLAAYLRSSVYWLLAESKEERGMTMWCTQAWILSPRMSALRSRRTSLHLSIRGERHSSCLFSPAEREVCKDEKSNELLRQIPAATTPVGSNLRVRANALPLGRLRIDVISAQLRCTLETSRGSSKFSSFSFQISFHLNATHFPLFFQNHLSLLYHSDFYFNSGKQCFVNNSHCENHFIENGSPPLSVHNIMNFTTCNK